MIAPSSSVVTRIRCVLRRRLHLLVGQHAVAGEDAGVERHVAGIVGGQLHQAAVHTAARGSGSGRDAEPCAGEESEQDAHEDLVFAGA